MAVGTAVGVAVGIAVGVAVGADVGVAVGSGVDVASGSPLQAARTTVARESAAIRKNIFFNLDPFNEVTDVVHCPVVALIITRS